MKLFRIKEGCILYRHKEYPRHVLQLPISDFGHPSLYPAPFSQYSVDAYYSFYPVSTTTYSSREQIKEAHTSTSWGTVSAMVRVMLFAAVASFRLGHLEKPKKDRVARRAI